MFWLAALCSALCAVLVTGKDPQCLIKAPESHHCLKLYYLWTWDEAMGACVQYVDCYGPYHRLGPNVYLTREDCQKTCIWT